MRKVSLYVFIILGMFTSLPLPAQDNFTEGTVSRVTLVRIKPGHATEFWADVRQNLEPIYEEYKKQGIITGYQIFIKATTENSTDWNVGLSLIYSGYGALDGLANRVNPITLKFYGSTEARAEAGRKRTQHSDTISSFLIRDVDPRPMPGPAPAPR